MSRRHASPLSVHHRALVVAAAVAIALTAILPTASLAQPARVDPKDIELRWQVLEYRDATGRMTPFPPGVNTTFLPFAGFISGEAPCGEYRAAYDQAQQTITIQPPEITRVACDPDAQAVDDAFYDALANAASLSLKGDILTVYDVINKPLLTLTAAQIPLDPTIARWELARVGNPDGSVKQIRGVAPQVEFLRGGGESGALTGRIVGTTGCGSFLGSYRTFDSTMTIEDVDYRLTGCTEELALQAEDFVAALGDITDFLVLPAGLALLDESDTTRLALVPQIELGERIWTPTEILDDDGEILPLSEFLSTSAVQFFGGSANGQSYCRGFDGSSISSGLALSTDAITAASGRCSGKARTTGFSPLDIEEAFLNALRATASHALRGDELELLDREGRPVMRLEPQADLEGRTWVLAQLNATPSNKRSRRKVIEGSAPTAIFTSIGVIKGDTGATRSNIANDYTAFYTTPGAGRIEIEKPARVGSACNGRRKSSKVCVQESDFLRLLEAATGVVTRDEDMRLLQGRQTVLWFVPEDAVADELEP